MTRSSSVLPLARPLLRFIPLASWAIVIAGLYFAREVLIPISVATLLSFLLAPLVARLEKFGLRRMWATVFIVIIALGFIGALGYVVGNQFADLASKLPQYKGTLTQKVRNLKSGDHPTLGHVREALSDLSREIGELSPVAKPTAKADGDKISSDVNGISHGVGTASLPVADVVSTSSTAQPEGVPVRIMEMPTSYVDAFTAALTPLLSTIAVIALLTLFVFVMLLHLDDLRDRVIRLAGHSRIRLTTEALNEAGSRVSHFLIMQVSLNAAYGVIIGIGLGFIGIPNAILWGALTAVLRFIPYVGIVTAASLPVFLSMAIFHGWTHTALTLGLFAIVEIACFNVFEPLLYAKSTGISPVAVVVSAVFWTWLWGWMGLLLSMPLTVCVSVLGRHIPQLNFLHIILGNEPVLSLDERLYNRLLAGDLEGGRRLLRENSEDRSAASILDGILLPALSLAKQDRNDGSLSGDLERHVNNGVRYLLKDVLDTDADVAANKQTVSSSNSRKVMVVPAHDDSDELTAQMLVSLLGRKGHQAKMTYTKSLASELIEEVASFNPDVVVVCALSDTAVRHARYFCKRLREAQPDIRIITGLWAKSGSSTMASQSAATGFADGVVTTMGDAIAKV